MDPTQLVLLISVEMEMKIIKLHVILSLIAEYYY